LKENGENKFCLLNSDVSLWNEKLVFNVENFHLTFCIKDLIKVHVPVLVCISRRILDFKEDAVSTKLSGIVDTQVLNQLFLKQL
jgi:hypothetical protein